MLSLLKHIECPACGQSHNFCLIAGHITCGEEYVYVCPETSKPTSLRAAEAGEEIRHYPQGAVRLMLANTQRAAA